jgi:hypothetical protein
MATGRLARDRAEEERKEKGQGQILLVPPQRKLRMSRSKVEH